ncbi:MAG: SGNH/GDSL hydrolase family protein [Mycobacteriales bacterium]
MSQHTITGRRRRRPRIEGVLRALIVALAAAMGIGLAPLPAGAAGPAYAALGDSYSSGVGTRSYLNDGSGCYRSRYAYPSLVASAKRLTLHFGACGGATASDVTARQLGYLSTSTVLVTVSAGGNDAGFSSVMRECAKPWWTSNCAAAVNRARAIITYTLPARLDRMFSAIRARAPYARVVAVGYPWLFNGQDCNAGTFFSPDDEARLNSAATLLDRVLKSHANAHGAWFVDPRSPFLGHRICDARAWINGLSNPLGESYHPNRSGQAGYAGLVKAKSGR